MKKLLLLTALSLTSALASSSTSAASTMTPLIGQVELYAGDGQVIGSVRDCLVELKPGFTLKDVSALRVTQLPDAAHNHYYMSMDGAPTLMWFGPSGQKVEMKLSLLSRMEWLSATGRLSSMNLTTQ